MAVARINLNSTAMRNLLTGPTGPVVRHITTLTRRTTNKAKRNCPVDEGTLRASIQGVVVAGGNQVIGRVGTGILYGLYQERGTGIYGPYGRRIYPVRRRFLKFEVKHGKKAKGSRPIVFAKSVRGVKPTEFLISALRDTVPYPVTENPL